MSLKQPYLDVRGLSAEEAYKLITDCLDRHFAYQNKKAFPKYRFQQILNAITHAPLSEEQSRELKKRVEQLRGLRKTDPEYKHRPSPEKLKQKAIQKANRKARSKALIDYNNNLGGTSTMFRTDHVDLPNPQSAHIISGGIPSLGKH